MKTEGVLFHPQIWSYPDSISQISDSIPGVGPELRLQIPDSFASLPGHCSSQLLSFPSHGPAPCSSLALSPKSQSRQVIRRKANFFTSRGQSLDFVFLSAGGISDAHFRLIDNSMRVGGVAAFRLAPHPAKPFNLPANYQMVYIQNIGLTIIAVKKLYQENDGGSQLERRLLSVSATKERALQVDAMEDAVLEKPVVEKHLKKLGNFMRW